MHFMVPLVSYVTHGLLIPKHPPTTAPHAYSLASGRLHSGEDHAIRWLNASLVTVRIVLGSLTTRADVPFRYDDR